MQSLAQIDDQQVGQLVLRTQPEYKIGKIVKIVVGSGGRRFCELAAVSIQTHQRVGVLHVRVDGQVFITGLQTVPPEREGIVDARVDVERILELRVSRLASELREAIDGLSRQAAGDRTIFR